MKRFLQLIFAVSVLSGCGKDEAAIKASFENPEKIGILPDGRVVKMVRCDMGINGTHFVYFVDNSVSVNYRQGKLNRTIVLIDGVEYVRKEEARNE